MPTLGNDLALIRKHHDLSLEEIHHATRIPVRILSSIEDDSLFQDMEEHKTYLRSYVRSYAKALKIDEETIVRALDQTGEGRYEGLLRKREEGLDEPRFQLDEEEEISESGDGEEAPDSPGDPRRGMSSEEEDNKDMVHDHVPPASDRGPAGTSPGSASRTGADAARPETQARTPAPPDVSSVDWADMGKKFHPLQSGPRLWIVGIVIAVLLAAAAAYFLFGRGGAEQPEVVPDNENTPSSEQQMNLAPDSLQLELSSGEAAGTAGDTSEGNLGALEQEAASLPDTLTLAIYAAYGRLEPVRVNSDLMNGINPYWIEEDVAYTFDFLENIQVRGEYDQMELLMNGRPIPDLRESFYNQQSQMLEINREYFENDPVWLQPPPDSLPMSAPPPQSIRERPTFN